MHKSTQTKAFWTDHFFAGYLHEAKQREDLCVVYYYVPCCCCGGAYVKKCLGSCMYVASYTLTLCIG